MKHFYSLILAFFVCSTHAMDIPTLEDDGRLWDIFDDPTVEQDLMIDGFLDTVSLDMLPSRKINPENILPLINSEAPQAFNLLDVDFYTRTNALAKRSLLDLPIFEIHQCAHPHAWVVGFHLFWNKTDRAVFGCDDNTNISSYINLADDTFLGTIEEILNNSDIGSALEGFSDQIQQVDFNEILQLFGAFTVEERRTGIMSHAWYQRERNEIRMWLPLYYQERNVFADPAVQSVLERKFGVLNQAEQESFEKNHAVSDRIGLGDFRFEYDYAAYKTDTTNICVGIMSTIPTAVTISTGLRGTSFEKSGKIQPTLNLQNLFDLINITSTPDPVTGLPFTLQPNAQQTATQELVGDVCRNKNGFLLGALDRLNAILLDTKLGNNRHFGFGPLFRAHTSLDAFLEEFEWAHRINFNNRLSFEFFTPADETRFFAQRNTKADLDAHDFSSIDPIIARENLDFIEQELVNKFYPIALTVNVQPGFIFRYTTRWCFCGDVWDLNVGSDIWVQQQEKFNDIKTNCKRISSHIDECAALSPFAFQWKYFAGIGLKVVDDTHSWFFSLNAEGTTWNKGIGKDWTASLNIEANF